MKTLYEINQNQLDLINSIIENEGELTDEINKELSITENELKDKALSYIDFIGDREAFISRIDTEIKRLQAIKKSNVSLVDRLKTSLNIAVSTFGEFTTGLYKVTQRKSEAVEVYDEILLDSEYITEIVTKKADKKALKAALKEGKDIEGATLVTRVNLSIK